MTTEDLSYMPAHALARAIRQRQLSPVEVVRAVLDRAQRSQPALNAFITLCPERALVVAQRAEAAVMRGEAAGPLLGVPFSVKDLVNTAGVRTTYGSLIFEHHVPEADAVAVGRLKAAGAILIGKTTTPEFGQKGLTEAPLFGRTRNAWRADRTSGGSSGGAAVALACGLGPLAVGTDGGGSTRIPAACNGVVGLKQSLGVVPHDRAEDAFGNISYITAMARTVADTALMLDAMAGPHASDPHTLNRVRPGYFAAAAAGGDLAGLKVAWRPRIGNSVVAAQVLASCADAAQVFADLGGTVVEMPTTSTTRRSCGWS
jgi:aspartyl-tRNA(Asn)/glutamyl-tRNA(Gln) amidotransferase subunit A